MILSPVYNLDTFVLLVEYKPEKCYSKYYTTPEMFKLLVNFVITVYNILNVSTSTHLL